jgi:hypothetical protein
MQMITAVVQFKLPAGTTLEDASAIFESTVLRYRGMSGLMRKYYLFDPEAGTGGGCYLFKTRAAAEAIFDDAWRALIKEKCGAEPDIHCFETPVVVDNVTNEIIGGANAAAEKPFNVWDCAYSNTAASFGPNSAAMVLLSQESFAWNRSIRHAERFGRVNL